jgi:hypothetical protein
MCLGVHHTGGVGGAQGGGIAPCGQQVVGPPGVLGGSDCLMALPSSEVGLRPSGSGTSGGAHLVCSHSFHLLPPCVLLLLLLLSELPDRSCSGLRPAWASLNDWRRTFWLICAAYGRRGQLSYAAR